MIRRREFITLLGGAAEAWPLAARAQQPTMPVVAFIHGGAAEPLGAYAGGFRKGLGEVGFREGNIVTIEYHWLEGRYFGFIIASQRQVLCFLATVLASVKALIEIGVLAWFCGDDPHAIATASGAGSGSAWRARIGIVKVRHGEAFNAWDN